MYAVIELTKTGLHLESTHATKQEAEHVMADLVSTWTHWNLPDMPCQKKFAVLEVAQV